MSAVRTATWPDPAVASRAGGQRRHLRLFPVFISFAGCGQRCIYCNQPAQTGAAAKTLEHILQMLQGYDNQMAGKHYDVLAFYGGSFTALPPDWATRFLRLAKAWKQRGSVKAIRCSTRPDAINALRLQALKDDGLDEVEVGVQSFQDAALAASGRAYSGAQAVKACEDVQAAGCALGIQLMPGLPGQQPGDLNKDVEAAIALRPDGLRLYPCVVFKDTPLADIWRAGAFRPVSLEAMAWRLGGAVLRCWQAEVPLWRIGLLEQRELQSALLDGPHHPAMGAKAKARAIFLWMKQFVRTHGPPSQCLLPQRASGVFWGVGNEMAPWYAKLGITSGNVQFHPETHMEWRT